MAAVVRVKRRINEEPLNAFILNCKRRKFEDESNATTTEVRESLLESKDEVSTILKFAGTVESQDENIGSQITKLSKDDAKRLAFKSRKPNISERNRKEMRQNLHDNRFKVVNCFRTIHNDDNNESTPKEITVVDIEKHTEVSELESRSMTNDEIREQQQHLQHNQSQQNTSSQTTIPSTSIQHQNVNDYFVYDLYIPETIDQQNMNVDYSDTTYLSVRPFDDLVYEERFNNDDDENSSMNESEDSNAEDYWKNDYPDTEESISDSDMKRAVNYNRDEEDLSSDDEDYYEGYVHSKYSDEFEDDMDYYESSNRYGSAYAKYKARLMKQKEDEDELYELDDSSDND